MENSDTSPAEKSGTTNAVERPLLNPTFTPVSPDGKSLHLVATAMGGPRFTLRDEDGEGGLVRLPELMDGSRTISDIADEIDSTDVTELKGIVEQFRERNIVLDAATVEQTSLFGYVALQPHMLETRARGGIENTVLVVGPDQPRSIVVDDLVEFGITDVRISEDDVSGTSTAPRPEVRFTDSSLSAAVEAADFVIGVKRLPSDDRLLELNEHAVATETPWICATVERTAGSVGPIIVPGRTACYECYCTRLSANADDQKRFQTYHDAVPKPDSKSALTAFERIIASYTSIATLNFLLSGSGFAVGSEIAFDFFDWTIEANDVLKLPRCSCCSPTEIGHQRFVELDQFRGGEQP